MSAIPIGFLDHRLLNRLLSSTAGDRYLADDIR
jgi:hypothetical protein